jgi:hypothetical protein
MENDIILYEAYFQKGSSYYIDKLHKRKEGKIITFNVPAFLFGPFWLLYRRMNFEALAFMLIIIAEGTIELLLFPEGFDRDSQMILNLAVPLIMGTILGFLSNYLYLKKADKVVEASKNNFNRYDEQVTFIKKKGGVSYWLLSILLLFFTSILILSIIFPDA